MTRTIFLSSGGDPFLCLFVLKLFQERFYDEADKFYINYNNHCGVPQEVIAELLPRLIKEPKVQLIYHPNGIGNGRPITEMTHVCREDLVMLLEDDGFIFENGIVNECFQNIESDLADAVGSPRLSCGNEIAEALRLKYNLDYTGYGDVGPNFWPNFFFCKRKDLLKTDLNFASVTFKPGDYYKELDHTFQEVNHGDTFVWACIQLRALGLRFHNIPQHKLSPYEVEDKQRGEMNYHPSQQPYKWLHGGSLSTSWGGYLSGRIPDVSEEISKREIESRVSMWQLISDTINKFPNFLGEYRAGIDNLITNVSLDKERIKEKYELCKNLMKL